MIAHEASSSSSSKSKLWNHDVFLSFRGEDTRKGFTSHLHDAIEYKGYKAYMDEDDLKRGEEIKEELYRGIEESRISIIVLSKKYADSSWCLDELVKIMECKSKLGRHVLPIFYHVDPSHVRKQDGDLAKAFHKHKKGIGKVKDGKKREAERERVKQWRKALREAANLSGHHLQITDNRSEAEVVREIVDQIIREWLLSTNKLHVAKHQVGINSRIQDIITYLSIGGSDVVLMVGISGMGGLGKTTAAKAIYNQINHMFQFKSFLADVSDSTSRHGLVYLQEKLIFDILNKKSEKISNVDEGISLIEKEFQHRRVLVIMDNIDEEEQLNALAQNHKWFGPGSRIIITTRNTRLLLGVDRVYLAQNLNEAEALELFSWHAFRKSCPKEEYLEHSKSVVSHCGGLPLALIVMGSLLIERTLAEWECQLEKLERTPNRGIIEPLRMSFDGLDDMEKATFLHISCFFIGKDKDHVAKLLDVCGFFATVGISVLCERCLVTVEYNVLNVHDLLREMTRVIICEKSPDHPGKWSRLWNRQEVIDVLTNNSGTEEVEGLALHPPDHWIQTYNKFSFSTVAFANMKKLRLLQLDTVELYGEYKHLPKELIWLSWRGFRLQSIPDDFFNQPRLLVLDMQSSNLVQVWEGSKSLQKLKILNLSDSHFLIESPDFSQVPELKELILSNCMSLSWIHPSIGHLKRLSFVNLSYCRRLISLPEAFYKSKSVETLYLNRCSKFRNPLEYLGEMRSLKILEVASTKIPIKQVPYLGSLISLENLNLERNDFHTLPSLSGLSKLETLWLSHCHDLHTIHDLPTNLKFLNAPHCPALATMSDFSEMSNMRQLNLSDSCKLTEVPGLDKSLNSMTWIDMHKCTNLTADFRKNILQGWISCGFGGIALHGNYVPDWFEFVNDGNKVNFDIPPSDDRNFEGLTLLCVYDCKNYESDTGYLPLAITVINNTKRTKLQACISLEFIDVNIEMISLPGLWQGQLSNDKLNLQGGDKIEVEIVFAEPNFPRLVKRTGVNLVWDKPLKENMHDLAYVLSHIQPGSMVRHNQSGDASSSSHM